MKKKRLSSTIPSDILKTILRKDEDPFRRLYRVRYYSYLEYQGGNELAVSCVAVKFGKTFKNKSNPCRYVKKVCIHVLGDTRAYYRDIHYAYIAGYIPEFYLERDMDTRRKRIIVNEYSDESWYSCEPKYFRLFGFGNLVNPEFLDKTEKFKYCAWDGETDILKYLEAYEKNPKIEMISKLLGTRFATSKTIVRKAEKDKDFIFWMRDHKQEILNERLPVILRAYAKGWSIEAAKKDYDVRKEFLEFTRTHITSRGTLGEIYKNSDEDGKKKIIEYVKRNDVTPSHYNDYLQALKELNIDLTDTKNLFPKDFAYWSQVRMDQYATEKAKKDAKAFKELTRKIKAVASKYSALTLSNKSFCVIIASDKESLIREGAYLHHCVGQMNYDQRIAKEKSLIFFIRKAEEQNIPFVTVEFSIETGKVLQCYGEHDSRPSENVRDFVYNVWEKQAQKKLKKIQKEAA